MAKIGICGDIHGRQFWKVFKDRISEFDKVVILGDYLACYPSEWPHGVDYNQIAIERFKEIVQFKKDNPDKVILLFGNHDASYLNTDICECRTDHKNWKLLNEFYINNIELFDLAWETKINGKRYFFSHSGVRKGWFDKWVRNSWFKWDGEDLPAADKFNDAFHKAYGEKSDYAFREKIEKSLGVYSKYRGWGGENDGSIVWADIREYFNRNDFENDYENVIFICGHTQLTDEPIIKECVADLDCRKPFVLDTETGLIKNH